MAYKIKRKRTVKVGDMYQGMLITRIKKPNTLSGITSSGKIQTIKWKKDQWETV